MMNVLTDKKTRRGIKAATTSATPLDMLTLDIQEGVAGYIGLDMSANDGTDNAAYKMVCRLIRPIGGVVAVNVSSLVANESAGAAAWACTIVASSTSQVSMRLTGAAATNITWLGQAEYQLVGE